jgi:hypothetical protein
MDGVAFHRVELGVDAPPGNVDDVRREVESAGWSLVWIGEPGKYGRVPLCFDPISQDATFVDVASRISYEIDPAAFRDVVNELTASGYFFSGEIEGENGRVICDFAPLSEMIRLSRTICEQSARQPEAARPPENASSHRSSRPRGSLVRDAAVAGLGIYSGHEIWESVSGAGADVGDSLFDGLLDSF